MKFTKTFSLIGFFLIIFSCKKSTKINGDIEESSKKYEFTNELINETSPYLLQHAHNPVHWKPWTNSVFEDADKENRLIVLSIGYSTCHWCHVMEEESFEDKEVAQLMNDKFVNIKVDREERPDVDMVYQTALQLVNGAGGWPINAILLSDGSPVYLGTYHDKDEWISVLTKFSEEFERNPEKMKEYASMLASGVQEVYEQPSKQNQAKVTQEKVVNAIRNWSNSWDLEWGGDRGQQKFIIPTNLSMLLDYSFLQKDMNTSAYVLKTLEKVSQGGIYDHVGGGFFRYSTDSKWKVPHFEKMLYDNAQMLSLLSKAYKLSGNEEYETLTKQIFQFLKSEMRDEKGGYFSAMDADTNGEEGLYYLWTKDELLALLGDEFDIFGRYFAINKDEVLENGKYVLSVSNSVADFSKRESIPQKEMNGKIKEWKSLLYEYRKTRETPSKDYKVITSWNSLLIDGLIEAYKTFGDATYLEEAKTTFEFLESNNYKNQELVHSYTANSKQKEVFLEDYAFFAKSAFGLYSVTLEFKYLDLAKELMETAIKKYSTSSGFYYYNVSNEMIPKIINTNDGVLPSANAIMAQNLFILGHLEYNKNYLKDAEILGSLIVEDFERQASNYGAWGSLLLHQAYPYYEIAIVGQKAKGLITKMNTHYLGNTLLVASSVPSDISLFRDRFLKEDTYIYVCQNSTCKLPVTTIDEAFEQLYSFGYEDLGVKKFELSF